MKRHTTKYCKPVFICFFWLIVWQAGAVLVGNSILFVGPAEVIHALFSFLPQSTFWVSVFTSFWKISTGFFLAFFGGMFIGCFAFFFPLLQQFLSPLLTFMKSVPVASFVILALIWMGSDNLSVLISFLVVFPVIYVNTLGGLAGTDAKLLEMSQVFHLTRWRKWSCLYWPSLLPYLSSGCKTALGMSWKSGIAAEVIGVPDKTIGEQLYLSKIYLNTAELFSWTLVIILVSMGFERIFLFLLNKLGNKTPFLPVKRSITKKERENAKSSPYSPITLTITNLTKHFDEQEIFLHQSFQFVSDFPWCIMAPSGSGKTTFFHLLLGLEQAETGTIMISHNQKEGNSDFLISAVFQENRLCESLSPIDNILLAVPSVSKAEAKTELSQILPTECLNRPVFTLSGGMKRRTAIVRALLFPAPVILMDEPFTGLDEETKSEVIHYIVKRRNGRLLLLSTHQEEDADLLRGKILFLNNSSSVTNMRT